MEANDFAAELLMPARLFAADAARLDLSMASAQHLGGLEMYHVSVTAAAWRIVQTSREPCALVVSRGRTVEWIARSAHWRLPLTERNQRLHPETLAARSFQGAGAYPNPSEVQLGVWLEERTDERGILLESTHIIPRLNQVLSLLWLVDTDAEGTE
jgi:hypothetical protein